ncbi:entericidin A/B family lipoprotein [Yoonia litorea]|uniref:Entericidin EcnA/B family protein n=1 Tax=Yoonia litorea TaxID=1123755 RepID=A0A1I6MJ51_9RHOB|nr:entericidin A/B family lipoprotein [Yoonia litorea]SFS15735.1 Entericidin EcnA/B family protein [Yoonia litorea]
MIRIALVLAILGLAACETIQGAGRDITAAGQTLDRTF